MKRVADLREPNRTSPLERDLRGKQRLRRFALSQKHDRLHRVKGDNGLYLVPIEILLGNRQQPPGIGELTAPGVDQRGPEGAPTDVRALRDRKRLVPFAGAYRKAASPVQRP